MKGFASPAQFKGDDVKGALIRNWRQLTTFINTWVVRLDPDGSALTLPGDLTVGGDLTVTGSGLGSSTSYGAMYVSTPAATTISVAGTYVKAAGTTTIGTNNVDFTMPANNRLTYGGTDTKVFAVSVDLTFYCATGYNEMRVQIAKNGTVIAESAGGGKQTASGTAAVTGTAQALVSLATTDYVEIWITNVTSTANITVSVGSLMAVSV